MCCADACWTQPLLLQLVKFPLLGSVLSVQVGAAGVGALRHHLVLTRTRSRQMPIIDGEGELTGSRALPERGFARSPAAHAELHAARTDSALFGPPGPVPLGWFQGRRPSCCLR
jgi:hypothetical protein